MGKWVRFAIRGSQPDARTHIPSAIDLATRRRGASKENASVVPTLRFLELRLIAFPDISFKFQSARDSDGGWRMFLAYLILFSINGVNHVCAAIATTSRADENERTGEPHLPARSRLAKAQDAIKSRHEAILFLYIQQKLH